jgi:L-iditol 2-dehydrogenase
MIAIVKTAYGEGNIELLDRPVPTPGESEVLIRVKFAGICGTDIHIWHDQFVYYPPVILGHEFSGVVEATGSRVKKIKPGQRVVAEPHSRHCGVCSLCRNGHIQICNDKRSPGWGIDGAFTDYVVMPENLLHVIPEQVSFEEAAMLEPCAIAAHQVYERGGITPGDVVVVCGAGPIGIISAQLARLAGAGTVIMTGLDSDVPLRFEVARQINCVDRFVNVQRENLAGIIDELTDFTGADVVIEASGAESSIRSAVHILRKRGKLTAIGLSGRPDVAFPWNEAMLKVLDVYFNMSSSYNGWQIAIRLLAAGRLNVKPLITEIVPLDQWEESFNKCQRGEALKILFRL